MAGIIARLPVAIGLLMFVPGTGQLKPSLFTLGSVAGDISLEKLDHPGLLFVGGDRGRDRHHQGAAADPDAVRKHVRGRRVVGGTRTSCR